MSADSTRKTGIAFDGKRPFQHHKTDSPLTRAPAFLRALWARLLAPPPPPPLGHGVKPSTPRPIVPLKRSSDA